MKLANDVDPKTAFVVYDGDCPFCRSYVSLMRLKNSVGKVSLVDARLGGPLTQRLREEGFDLNEGMAAVYGNRIYYGEDAVVFLSTMIGPAPILGRAVGLLLRSQRRARLLYPVMKFFRKLTLRFLGIPMISTQ